MLIIEKIETALDTIRDVDIKQSKETVLDRLTQIKEKLVAVIPFAPATDFSKLEKKINTLNRKMNQLKKQLKELDV